MATASLRPRSAEFTVNSTGLQWDRDYGMNKRTGWTAVYRGSVLVQFVSLHRAAWRLVADIVDRRRNPEDYR